MSSTGITEKELFAIENEVMPETTRRSTKYGINKNVDWFFFEKKMYSSEEDLFPQNKSTKK